MNSFHLHLHFHSPNPHPSEGSFARILERLDNIMATQAEATASLKSLANELASTKELVSKVSGETSSLLEKIAALTAQLETRPDLSPELKEALEEVSAQVEAVKAAVQLVDEQVPDPTVG